MITSIDKETMAFLCKKQLTFNQFCMCLLIVQDDVAQIIQYSNEVGYLTGGTVMKPDQTIINELKDLIERGFLKFTFTDKSDRYSLDNYAVTEKFTKGFLDMFPVYVKELWDKYPDKIAFSEGDKNIAKAVNYEEYEEIYTKVLKKDISVHKQVMQAVGRLGKYAPMKIDKFIQSRHYERVEEDGSKGIRLY